MKYRLNPAGISRNRVLALRVEAKTIQKMLRDYPELYSNLGRKINRRLAMLYYKLGVQYVIGGRLEEGRREFLRAARESPLLPKSYLYYLLTFVNEGIRRRILATKAVDILRGVLS